MPLYLQAPRGAKAPNYKVRGQHQGVVVDRSTGTPRERDAKKILARWKGEIERGEYVDPQQKPDAAVATGKGELVFGEAVVAYLHAKGKSNARYLKAILELRGELELGQLRLSQITQAVIDKAAAVLYPNGTGATRNRNVYSPVSAVLHHVGDTRQWKRPDGAGGKQVTTFLSPDQAAALIPAAYSVDSEFGLFCFLLLYTGMRLSEGLNITINHLALQDACIHIPKTKNGDARTVHLTPELVVALANHPRGLDRHRDEKLVNFTKTNTLYNRLWLAMQRAGLKFPPGEGGFHLFCHTYGTWMARYNGMSSFDLARTGRWKDPRSADRYNHMAVQEQARKADNLPSVLKRG